MVSSNTKKLVAIVMPLYKMGMTSEEEISFKHLVHFLSKYDIYLVMPDSLQVDWTGFDVRRFGDQFFTSTSSYSNLLLTREFYETFSAYRYILIYQLDSLVFSDQLRGWCEAGYDYIGAPWFKSKTAPSKGFSRVGNGGFSLRKVESFLKVLDSQRHLGEPVPYWRDAFLTPLDDIQSLPIPQRYLKKTRVFRDVRRGVKWYMSNYTLNEDHFWSDRAKLFYPGFKIAPVDVALRFSFERFPRYCFEQNNHRLPFGCHAWAKWDREFWEPYLSS
jgi:hypothetical protein